jgi:predicted transcriptional regulator
VAGPADRSVALLSIHPRYADAILDGSKRVEFRRSSYPAAARFIVIYSTAPVQRVIGWFEIDGFSTGSPGDLWRRYRDTGQVTDEAFLRYFDACPVGTAIQVGRAVRLTDPVTLDHLSPGLTAPQSYRYLRSESAIALGIPVGPTTPAS